MYYPRLVDIVAEIDYLGLEHPKRIAGKYTTDITTACALLLIVGVIALCNNRTRNRQ
jgi:hypothetical protein